MTYAIIFIILLIAVTSGISFYMYIQDRRQHRADHSEVRQNEPDEAKLIS